MRVYTICHSFYAVLSRTTLFAILSSLKRVYTTCHSQQSDQCLHYFPFFLRSIIKVYTVCYTQQSDQGLHCQQSDQGLHYLPFSAVRSVSTLFAILSLIRVYTVRHSQQSGQGLHYLPFSAVWSRSRCTLSFSGTVRSGSRGARWLSGRVSDSRARGPGFETYRRRVVSLSKTLYSPKVLVNYPGSDGSVPTWLKNCWLGR